nr:J domain-containing protein [Prochloraceae cyanobacterium]
MLEMEGLDSEIHSLFDEILTQRKLGKKTRKEVTSIYEMLQFMGQISPVESQEEDEDEDSELDELFGLEEENSQESNGTDGGTQEKDKKCSLSPEDGPQSSKQLRQTFLRLAEIYHPDKVSDPETQKRHTEIMKEVNRAYKEGDAARLLELERL